MDEKVFAPRAVLWWILVTGAVGLFGAGMLTYERIRQQLFPNESLSCDLNVWVSCGSVMKRDQAHIFGFPNSWVGVIGFVLVVGFAAMQLFFYRQYSKRVWASFVAGLGFALTFVGFLLSQSLFVIHILCPYCMVVWAATIPLFIHVVFWIRTTDVFEINPRSKARAAALYEWSWVITLVIELATAAVVYVSFIESFRAL
ncbi:MAG: hypothetical protein RLZ28_1258 [Actinomycetota bacterium]|jgi:uncharacterized membrane protein